MATETSIKLPSIEVTIKSSRSRGEEQKNEDTKLSVATSFLSRLQLGSLQQQRRPGDVWGATTNKNPRPLGLIPDRDVKFDFLRELNRFLPPLSLYAAQTTQPVSPDKTPQPSDEGKTNKEQPIIVSTIDIKEVISATVRTSAPDPLVQMSNVPPPTVSGLENEQLQYRHPKDNTKEILAGEIDRDYLETLAKCEILKYYTARQQGLPLTQPPPVHINRETWSGPVQQIKINKSVKLGRTRSVSSGPRFVNISEQSELFDRTLLEDKRLPLAWEPCARCRERGGRCKRCKVLRVGGGYIILDGEDISDEDLKKRVGKRYTFSNGQRSSARNSTGRRGRRGVASDGDDDKVNAVQANVDDGHSGGVRSGRGGVKSGGWEEGRNSGLSGRDSGDGRLSSRSEKDHQFRVNDRDRNITSGRGKSDHGLSEKDDIIRKASGGATGGHSDGGGGGSRRMEDNSDGRNHTDGDGSGRTSSRGIAHLSGSSRPGSQLASRPPSSVRKRGLDHRGRDKRAVDIDSDHGKGRGRVRGNGDNGSESDGSDGDGKNKRRRKKQQTGDGMDDEPGDLEKTAYNFKGSGNEEVDPRPMSGYHGNLMRFKRKKDNVKAIHATLQELQGIDPLDYLAKYCIIDQNKLPHYHLCYDNVDRDEDDEIDIGELDFALKAVNYDLISDSEMSYVHSVLELAGRHKLNFRLFSLIAALSEKVVALEDMVKRLINKMDFQALEAKIKKCKELFYLLADSESHQEHEGGVVTTGSLSVELQAGGLTGEHVEFVVDRLNHDNKGLVEFLDYLTYVPLFVEIHDSISGNPLDFSRTK